MIGERFINVYIHLNLVCGKSIFFLWTEPLQTLFLRLTKPPLRCLSAILIYEVKRWLEIQLNVMLIRIKSDVHHPLFEIQSAPLNQCKIVTDYTSLSSWNTRVSHRHYFSSTILKYKQKNLMSNKVVAIDLKPPLKCIIQYFLHVPLKLVPMKNILNSSKCLAQNIFFIFFLIVLEAFISFIYPLAFFGFH